MRLAFHEARAALLVGGSGTKLSVCVVVALPVVVRFAGEKGKVRITASSHGAERMQIAVTPAEARRYAAGLSKVVTPLAAECPKMT